MSKIDGKDAATRKAHPIFTGCLAYFPDALLAVAELSKIGNDKHNPGQPLHWSRGKSNDHADCIVRHQLDAGKWDVIDTPTGPVKVRHSTAVAWRALAQLQIEIEEDEKLANLTQSRRRNSNDEAPRPSVGHLVVEIPTRRITNNLLLTPTSFSG